MNQSENESNLEQIGFRRKTNGVTNQPESESGLKEQQTAK